METACLAPGQSNKAQVSCSRPWAELKWRRVGNSQCSLLWNSHASLSGGKESNGNPCLGMFDIKLFVNVSSNWSLQWGEIESVWHKNSIGSQIDASKLSSSCVLDSHFSCLNPLDSPSISRYKLTEINEWEFTIWIGNGEQNIYLDMISQTSKQEKLPSGWMGSWVWCRPPPSSDHLFSQWQLSMLTLRLMACQTWSLLCFDFLWLSSGKEWRRDFPL